ncbi:MAG: DUF2235 domain-containing protein [Balneolales bacterium]
MAKNIVIFCDGTGQEGGHGHNTNIYKMFQLILDRTPQQIVFYAPGVGTDFKKITGNIGGRGISHNIKSCYRFLFDYYESGDRIYLFGFSRGAATVRSLSSFIHYFGILPKARPELIGRAYRIYQIRNTKKRKEKADDFIHRHRTMWTTIRFIGCYDTVAALGLPSRSLSVLLDGLPLFRHRFHNFKLSESVEHAYQALAIDDERKIFHPKLWDSRGEPGQTIKQVWFCGMHTDVGGGYASTQLSDIPLVWLTQQAVQHGLLMYPGHQLTVREDADGHMHNSRGSWLTKWYRRQVRCWPDGREDKPVVHRSVLYRRLNTANREHPSYHPWILDQDHEVEEWVQYEDSALARTPHGN